MTIARYYTEAEARAVVIADGGDRPVISAGSAPSRNGRRAPEATATTRLRSKVAREITAQLTPKKRLPFCGSACNAESTAGLSVALIPVSSDVGFSMSEATPVIEQLVNDGLLTPARAVVLLS